MSDDEYISENGDYDSEYKINEYKVGGEIIPEEPVDILDADVIVETDAEPEPDEDEEEEEEDDVEIVEEINEVPRTPVKFHKTIIIVKPENRKSSNIMNRFEMCDVISIRAQQISKDNKYMIDVTDLDDPIRIAKRELMQRKCPLVLRRKMVRNLRNSAVSRTASQWTGLSGRAGRHVVCFP